MLVLTRRLDEALMIGNEVLFQVSEVSEELGQVKISIEAPAGVAVYGREVLTGVEETKAGVVITHKRRPRRWSVSE